MLKYKILFKMTGSISCYKACFLISKLVQNNCEVQVIASEAALKFIGIATLEGLTGKPVLTNLWEPSTLMSHINLGRWADLIIVAPATANYINKISQGIGDDLISCLFLSYDFKRPYLIAPAMNSAMFLHPVTKNSLEKLKSFGLHILNTSTGLLACGEQGPGRLLEPDLIFEEIMKNLEKPKENKSENLKKILITSGGTREPIDEVRFIGNTSTGSTSLHIAEKLIESGGYDVTFLHSESSLLPKSFCRKISFVSFKDLSEKMHSLLSEEEFDGLIHAAAVSDFSVESFNGKISSDSNSDLILKLQKNPKIVNSIFSYSKNKNIKLVAFKMTAKASSEQISTAVQQLMNNSKAHLVVHNDTSNIDRQRKTHLFTVYKKNKETDVSPIVFSPNSYELDSKESLAQFLSNYFNSHSTEAKMEVSQYDSHP